MKKDKSVFARRLAEARKAKGMNQMALALELGVHQQTVAFWETDRFHPPIDRLPMIAEVLHISLDWLFDVKLTKEAG